jgi:hypothetical protein
MEMNTTTVAIFAIIAATGLIWTITVSQPADAWHSLFGSRKLCMQYMTEVNGNTTKEANFMCNKVVPHN